MANNWFGKKIIWLTKKKICPSANTLSNKFLRKTMVMNVVSFWKYQKMVSCTIKAISYSNCHSFAAKLTNVSLFVKHMTEDFFFYKQLGQTGL